MPKIISISLTSEEKDFLDNMELSPTALMKQKIMEMMTSTLSQRKRIQELEELYDKECQNSSRKSRFIVSKGLLEEFNGFN